MTHLIEHESKFLLGASLREMHNNRIQNYYHILNFAIFGGFVIIVGLVLYNLKKYGIYSPYCYGSPAFSHSRRKFYRAS